MQIPIGARFVAIPGRETPECPKGVMVEVYWEADDSGALHITGHSQETPVPSTVQLQPAGAPLARTNTPDRNQRTYGIVIDPVEVST